MSYLIMNSDRKGKRYVAVPQGREFDENGREIIIKTVHFGSSEHENYTIHKDSIRKERYIKRHSKEDWTDLEKAGTWSRYILWNLPTLEASAKDMANHFGIKIVLAI